MDEKFYRRMYGAGPSNSEPTTPKQPETPEKRASRVLGGMKAQNSHTVIVEVDGKLVNLPKTEYVKLLEEQVKQMRATVQGYEGKYNRVVRQMGKLLEDVRRLELELKNKVDLR